MDGLKIEQMVYDVTKSWARKKKAEERSNQAPLRYYYSTRVTAKEAAYEVMEAAYLKASAGGKLYANARQIMYAARGAILERCDTDSLDSVYFTQTLLPNYINEHPETTAGWKVAFDARGSFVEPHENGRTVGLGTIDVDRHLREIGEHGRDNEISSIDHSSYTSYPTCGPGDRYGAVLFVEKEGFSAILKDSGLLREFDLAMASTKGQTVTACRTLVEELCGRRGLPLLVLHDFDVAGFNIAAMFGRDNRRFKWTVKPNAIDLGLRLDDVEEWSLESEPVQVKKHDRHSLHRDGATAAEIDFLCAGQRVELNAFTSGQLIDWLRDKLQEAGIKKVVPEDDTLSDAFRRAKHMQYVAERLEELDLDAEAGEHAASLALPTDLAAEVQKLLENSPRMTWDSAVAEIARRSETPT